NFSDIVARRRRVARRAHDRAIDDDPWRRGTHERVYGEDRAVLWCEERLVRATHDLPVGRTVPRLIRRGVWNDATAPEGQPRRQRVDERDWARGGRLADIADGEDEATDHAAHERFDRALGNRDIEYRELCHDL